MRRRLSHIVCSYASHENVYSDQSAAGCVVKGAQTKLALTSMDVIDDLFLLLPLHSRSGSLDIQPQSFSHSSSLPEPRGGNALGRLRSLPFPLLSFHLPLPRLGSKSFPDGLVDDPFARKGPHAILFGVQCATWTTSDLRDFDQIQNEEVSCRLPRRPGTAPRDLRQEPSQPFLVLPLLDLEPDRRDDRIRR